jgi:hypothetical protein
MAPQQPLVIVDPYAWERSMVTRLVLNQLVTAGQLAANEEGRPAEWIVPPARDHAPNPPSGYVVSFIRFHERGFAAPAGRFMRALCHHYGVELHNFAWVSFPTQSVSFPTQSSESQEGALVRRRDGHMVAGGRGHGAEASSSCAGRPAPGEGRADGPPAFADTQEEQGLWEELRGHGSALNQALNEALRIHGGPAWRVFQVRRRRLPFSLISSSSRSTLAA